MYKRITAVLCTALLCACTALPAEHSSPVSCTAESTEQLSPPLAEESVPHFYPVLAEIIMGSELVLPQICTEPCNDPSLMRFYENAYLMYSLFFKPLSYDQSKPISLDGGEYYPVIGGYSYADFEEALRRVFSPEVMDALAAAGACRYAEYNGDLYVTFSGDACEPLPPLSAFKLRRDSDTCLALCADVSVWEDPAKGTVSANYVGRRRYELYLEEVDGRWVFTNFPPAYGGESTFEQGQFTAAAKADYSLPPLQTEMPADVEVIAAYKRAESIHGWFRNTLSDGGEPITADGRTYYAVQAFASYAQFRTCLTRVFSEEITDYYLSGETYGYPMYVEHEGILYGMLMNSGGNMSYGDVRYTVASVSDTERILRVRVELLEHACFTEVVGYRDFDFTYACVNDRWVFTEFYSYKSYDARNPYSSDNG